MDHVTPPSALFSTTYVATVLPPVEEGAVQDNETWLLPASAVNVPGAVARPTAAPVKFTLYAPNPPFVTAATRNVYSTPADKLPTVNAVAVEPVLETTVVQDVPAFELRSIRYPISALPPVEVGAVHDNTTSLVPPIACGEVGALGDVNGVPDAVALAMPCPAALVATTRNT